MDTRRVPGIQQKGNKWRFRVRDGDGRRRWVWCDTLAEAVARGDKAALARAIAALRGEDR